MIFDARGLCCPVPVLRARKLLSGLKMGDSLDVLVTDKAAPRDFELFCAEQGHTFDSVTAEGDAFRISLRRGA